MTLFEPPRVGDRSTGTPAVLPDGAADRALSGVAIRPRQVLTSSASANWGTPETIRRLAACVLRPAAVTGQAIDLDVASSAYWQAQWAPRDRPAAYFDGAAKGNCLDPVAWSPRIGSVFCNPPGDASGIMVQAFWSLLVKRWQDRQIASVFWIGFNLEQLRSLQNIDTHPLSPGVCTLLPGRRVAYMMSPQDAIQLLQDKLARRENDKDWKRITEIEARADDSPVSGSAPTHASFLSVLWSHDKACRKRQQRALLDFLKGQKDLPRSPLQRCAMVGMSDGET